MDTKVLDNLIVGRVDPKIYAFSTNTIPDYLKVGDTYRPVSVRLEEWRIHFPDLKPQFEGSAKIDDDVFFRDYAVHQFLEDDLGKVRLTPDVLPKDLYFSNEFFKFTTPTDVKAAIADVKKEFDENSDKYNFYSTQDSLPVEQMYESTGMWKLRPNQAEAVKAFEIAVYKKRRTNLLMYAVMRFGKSFTSLCCAQKMNKGKGAKLVVVVSAKADVKDEWRKTVQSAENFRNDYDFLNSDNLKDNYNLLSNTLKKKKVVLFLTLQDLQGENIKDKHKELFKKDVDLLIVDETHFGARSEKYGQVLQSKKKQEDIDDDTVSFEEADAVVKQLNAKVTLHLSGTPYRILMGGEFEKEDIIAFCQFTDIVKAQKEWDEMHLLEDASGKKHRNEWDNPYYGFPQMIRFAFNPNESSLKKMEALRAEGKTAKISALFEPKKRKKGEAAAFIHEKEVLDLLRIIDGSKSESNILSFLDYDKLKEGKMCRHIVFVLPRCASCDALENLIRQNERLFKNLADYEILNISGANGRKYYKTPKSVKKKIHEFETNGSRTITLTVNRMLTGSTVEEWDTMIYLKDSSSPQEYDQAIFRLQNQFIKKYFDDKDDEIKFNMKPQTLLVDFDPTRMFSMQELKSQIYNVNVDESGNSKLSERIAEELEISPIVYFNKGKISQVQATDLLNIVSEYSQTRGVVEETNEIPVDLGLMNKDSIWGVISKQNELGSKSGFIVKPNEGDGDDVDVPNTDPVDDDNSGDAGDSANGLDGVNDDDVKNKKDPVKQFRMYYARILFYAFLTKSKIISLAQLIGSLDNAENLRICKNLGLDKNVLSALNKYMNNFMLSKLDYKIQHLNTLSHDKKVNPLKRAEVANQKFGRISESEIVTPSKIADEMIALLPKKLFNDSVKTNSPILDIAAKEGEFAIALCKRFEKFGIKPEAYKNLIYSIPSSSVAYEFTRKIYEILGLNINCIAEQFNSYDLLNVKIKKKKKLDYEKINKLLNQKKMFDKISLTDEVSGDVKMKFNAVVGNPPYQKVNEGDGNGADPIYHLFIDVGRKLSSNGTLIHPARFLFNAGKTPKEWNQKVLNDEHFKVVKYWPTSFDVFPTVDIKGGVAITLWNENEDFGKIGTFSAFEELSSILKKVLKGNFQSFADLVYPRDLYHLNESLYKENPWAASRPSKGHRYDVGSNVFDLFPELFFEEKPNDGEDYACVFGRVKNERNLKWIKKKYLKLPDNFDFYKVMVPKANGSGAIGEVLSTPVVGQPVVGHTLTFLSIGKFKTKGEANACLTYIKSKFARAMLGTLKVTQDNPRETWNNVPLQDFTSQSDIDWSKSVSTVDSAAQKKYKLSINEIDAQLYAKYKLTPEEITFIETHVKEMK